MPIMGRIRALVFRTRSDLEIQEELRRRVETRINDNVAVGMTPEQSPQGSAFAFRKPRSHEGENRGRRCRWQIMVFPANAPRLPSGLNFSSVSLGIVAS